MKIKLPIALRAALLTALSAAIYSTTAAADFSGDITTDTNYTTAQTVATGSTTTVSNNATAAMPSLTVQGTVNATAGKVALQTASTDATAPTMSIAGGASVSGNYVFQKTQPTGSPVIGSGVLNLTAGTSTQTDITNAQFDGIANLNVSGGSFKGGDLQATDAATVSAGALEARNLSAKQINATGGQLNVTENATGSKMTLSGGQHVMGDITLTAEPQTSLSSQTYNRKKDGQQYPGTNSTVDQVTVTTSTTTIDPTADGSLTVSGASTTLNAGDVSANALDVQDGTVTLDSLNLATVTTGTTTSQSVQADVPYNSATMPALQESGWTPDIIDITAEEGGKLSVAAGSLTVKGKTEADQIALSGGTTTLGVDGSTYSDVIARSITIGEGGAPTVTLGNVQALQSMTTKGGTTTVQSLAAKTLDLGGGTLNANGAITAETLNVSAATTLNLTSTGWSNTPLVSYTTVQGTAANLTTNLSVGMTAKGTLGSEISIFSGDEFSLDSVTTNAGAGYAVSASGADKWVYAYTATGASSPTWSMTMKYENGDLVVVGTSEGNHSEEVGTDTGVAMTAEGSGDSKSLTVQGTVTNADKATIATGGSSLDAHGATADVHAVVVTDNGVSTTENYVVMEASQIGTITGATTVNPNQVNTTTDATIAAANTATVNTGTLNVADDAALTLDGVQVNVDAVAPSENMQRYLASNDIDPMNSTIEGSVILQNGASLVSTDPANMTVLNGSVGGTGTLSGVTLRGESYLTAGNSPGVLTVSNIVTTPDGNNTWTAYAITNATQFGTMNDDTTTQLSQFKIEGNIQLNGNNAFVVDLQTAVPGANPGDPTTYEAASTEAATAFTNNLSKGTAFKFFDLSDGSLSGNFTSFDMAGTQEALIARGLTWDLSSLATTGEATVRSANEGDANRVANTLVSSSKTLFAFADGARNHVYSDRVTGSNFWVGGLGDFQDLSSHNGRNGYKYNGGGYAVGMDHKAGKNGVVGLAFGQMFGEMKPKDGTFLFDNGKIDQKMTMVGLYGGTLMNICNIKQGIHLDGYMAYGSSDNKSTRNVINPVMGYGGGALGNWNEDVFAVGGQASWVYQVCPAFNLRPFIGIDYTASRMENFRESGVYGLNNAYSHGHYQNLALSAGFGIDRTFTYRNGMALTPAASVAYVGDVVRQDGKVTVTNPDGSNFWERSVSPGRNAVRANAALTWKICSSWSARAGYVFEYRSGATQHGVNASLSYSF